MPRSVLLVHRSDDLAQITKSLLESSGCEVRMAADGAEAIRKMGERLARVVVIDNDPPDITACHLAIHLKAFTETLLPSLPCKTVALRGDVSPLDVMTLDGFDFVLSKPAAFEKIADAIQACFLSLDYERSASLR
ncbi:response regulator [Acidovorax sp. LjRoot194]|uniref:response regulator n=1 Tax=Acidovorax sp. LjRoot194 TaxID=3342280 RepID=UPI003ECD9C13